MYRKYKILNSNAGLGTHDDPERQAHCRSFRSDVVDPCKLWFWRRVNKVSHIEPDLRKEGHKCGAECGIFFILRYNQVDQVQ